MVRSSWGQVATVADRSRPAVQWSLRELFILVTFAGLGLASLRLAGVVGAITEFLSIILCFALGIIAFVGRNEAQAFAIGFLVPVIAYAGILLAAGKSELDPWDGKLPTSLALRPLFESVTTRKWINFGTGQEVPDYDPTKAPPGTPVGMREQPDRPTFMLLGHVLIALLFGYVGGKFAVAVYRRQRQDSAPAP